LRWVLIISASKPNKIAKLPTIIRKVVSKADGRYGVTMPVVKKWFITLNPITRPNRIHPNPIPEKIING
jgi:hypothetical protein